ncbi:DUF5936 domain-containing protein [Nocardiopsis rhodophaea]|uniref:DUF5936 domain-containing protein n=1 Tax=Nocardiopsis rhodophaea TaxID=280238 RepID=A0ABP5EN66_9ACTN
MTLSFPAILLLGLAGAMCVGLFVWGFYLMTSKAQVAADLTSAAPKRSKDEEEIFILHRITAQLGRPFLPLIESKLSFDQRQRLQIRIDAAGRPDNLTVERYLSRKAGEILLYGGLTVFMLIKGNILFAFLALGFSFMTDLNLYTEKSKRQDQIQRQLPDFLDVLAVTVGAGLSFRQALSRVADSMPGLLADEFRMTLRQMDLGTSRRDAFKALRARNKNESLGRFVSALQQAEELGAPLADALMTISQDIRRDDAQYLRRKAQKIAPRVTGITAATMLPGLLIVIGGGMFMGTDIDMSVFSGE